MEIKPGLIVKAKNGRDKDDFFVVLESDGKFVKIANGKRRKIEKPKTKNILHLALTNQTLNQEFLRGDKALRKALNTFKIQ